jgi:membrane-bound metal-dependent hydrolase YbcI (DUF457 family)
MDPVTHGITGALLGKAYFAGRDRSGSGRVAIFAATLGSVFPDVDIVGEIFARDPLAIARLHRGFTHSFFGLPVFAAALAWPTWWLTRWWCRRRGRDYPSASFLFLAYAAGIASHILLDAMTTFGTRIWNPFSRERVAWDLLFIIDFSLTAVVLLPQVAAWVHRERAGQTRRALEMWALLSLLALGVWEAARAAGFPFAPGVVAAASQVLAALFFLPAWGDWGVRVRRSSWCRAGVAAMLAYLAACGAAHHAALARVQAFAAANHVSVERIGALPIPPSLLDWGGLIRTPDGVYQAQFDLRDAQPPAFQFLPDTPPNRYIAAARALPDVGTYLWFARFPIIRYAQQGDRNIVDFSDWRFFSRSNQRPMPFTFRVILDANGDLLEEGWVGARRYLRREGNLPPASQTDSP